MISVRAIVWIIVTVVAAAAALGLLFLLRNVVEMVVIAAVLAVALGPAVDTFQRRRVPRGLAIILVYVTILLLIVAVGLIIVPPVVDEVDAFAKSVPGLLEDVRRSPTIASYDNRYGVTESLGRQAETIPQRLGGAVSALQAVTVGVFSTLFQLITILAIAFFLLLDGHRIVNFCFSQLGPEREPTARVAALRVYKAVGGYVVGAFSIALLAGVSTYVVLTILGVPFAVPLAVLMTFLDLIPLIGASVAGALIAFVAVFQDFPTTLIAWSVFFLLYQQVENNVLQPFVYKRTVELSALLVIVGVLCGATLLGVLGALLAIPAAATIQILVQTYWPGGGPTEAEKEEPAVEPAHRTGAPEVPSGVG